MTANPIIVDTDPGIDDALALFVLRRFAPDRVRMILTSYGNVSLAHTTENALTLCGLLDWKVPVVQGAERPCTPAGQERVVTAAHIHGEDGLGGLGLSFPQKGTAFAGDFLQKLYDTLCALERVDYLTLGPLTNLALLLRRFPKAAQHIDRVVSMGGGIGLGNVTPQAEFNIHCDPQGAAEVFASLPRITLVPLNVTNRAAFSLADIQRIASERDPASPFAPAAEAAEKILTINYHACIGYGERGATMHDSAAALCLLYPALFTFRQCGILVDCEEEAFGRTRITQEREAPMNVELAVDGQIPRLLSLIEESVRTDPGPSR